ncbi:MAG: Holliday junction resolvase RuvX [Candidatus Desulfofervidaceae bacterium]|nr:Holliday junction resolvase RuvX [Candidatus Desulfofervidaceae bacterium]
MSSRILSLDVGTKRIGVAISDELGWTAQPLTVIKRKNDEHALRRIKEIVEENKVSKIVVGLPLTLRGEIGKSAQMVLTFVEKLKEQLSIDITTWDESFSTSQAEDVLIQADVSRLKRKKVIDKVAAALILDSFLKAQSENKA